MRKTTWPNAKSLLLLAAAAILIISAPQKSLAAFGISPPFLHANHLVEGIKYSQTIFLVRDDDSQDVGINVQFSGFPEEIEKWITVGDGGDYFVIQKGIRKYPVEITINVPKNSGPRNYSGKIRFTTAPVSEAKSDGQVAINYGLQLNLNITVGDEIFKDFKTILDFLDIEEGWSPRVYVKFFNNGNIPERFDKAILELFDQFKTRRLAFVQKVENFPETPPFTEKEYNLEFPIDLYLGTGEYWGKATLYQNDKIVGEIETVFKVLEKGSLSKPIGLIYYLGGGIILLLAIILFVLKKRKTSN